MELFYGTPEKLNKTKLLLKRISLFTLCIELLGAFALSFRFVPMYGLWEGIGQAIFTSISCFCNCGFEILGNNSLQFFATDYMVVSICGILTIMGGLGFIVWNEIFERLVDKKKRHLSLRKTWYTFSTHSKLVFVMLIVLIVVGTLGFMVFEFHNPQTIGEYNMADKVFISAFHGIFARTTGMSIVNLMNMTNSGKFFTIILMLIGGAPGSTAGGIKTVTLAILFITMLSSVSRNKSVNVFRREISSDDVKQAITVLISALIIISIMTMVISSLNPQIAFIDIMFETVSSLANCGYSIGITAGLTSISKILLIVVMFIGRITTVTMTMAIAGKRFKQNNLVNYPVDDVIVG